MPHLPQMIPQVSSGHRESSPTKPRRHAPGLGQNADDPAKRRDVADASHEPLRHQDYQQPAVSSRVNRLQLSPLYPANPKPDDLNYNDTIGTREAREVFPSKLARLHDLGG